MKKLCLILLSLFLVGCQSLNQQSSKDERQQEKENLTLKEWKYLFWKGDTSKDGYYFIKSGDEESHISYYDYASKKELYLCNKPECQHKDETCTAYLYGPAMMGELFTYGDHLYRMETIGFSMNALGEREAKGPGIIQMDLDGQNRKELYCLENGYQFEHSSFVLADNKLYIPITKTQDIEVKSNEVMQVTTQSHLCSIDLTNGEMKEVFDMMDKAIIGVDKRQLIMRTMNYSENPQKYLDEKNYQKYDQLMMNAKVNYEIYDMDTKECKKIEVKQDEDGTYYQHKIYYTQKSALYVLDLDTQKVEKMIDLPKQSTFYLSAIIDDYVIVEQWKDNYIGSFKISLKKPQLETLEQYTRAPKEPVQIIAQTQDQLLVIYDREGKEEKTWAGTMQYETSKEYIGLISIKDFLNNQKNYQTIETLTKTRQS